MSNDHMIPPPYEVRRRAWEAAYDLISTHLDRLDPIARHIAGWIAARKVDLLTWQDCREAFALHRKFGGQP